MLDISLKKSFYLGDEGLEVIVSAEATLKY